jgi:hypothetical protein
MLVVVCALRSQTSAACLVSSVKPYTEHLRHSVAQLVEMSVAQLGEMSVAQAQLREMSIGPRSVCEVIFEMVIAFADNELKGLSRSEREVE